MDDLKCNSLRCRKSLALESGSHDLVRCSRSCSRIFAPPTKVEFTDHVCSSHIFCIDCANALFSLPQICPACETALPDPDDVVQTSLNPHDSYKTSILAGLSPTIILDIAGRALNFYAYQIQQEAAFQALITKNAQERIAILEAQCNTITREAHAEVNLLKEKLARTEKDLELQKRRNHDLQETHKANAKAYQKLRLQYDKAKQRALFDVADQSGLGNAGPVGVGNAGPGTPAFQQTFLSGLNGRGTPRPGGGGGVNHGPFSSVARQQQNGSRMSGSGTNGSGRDSSASWTALPGAAAPHSTTAQGPIQHYPAAGGGTSARQNGTTTNGGGSNATRPRHQSRQPGVPQQQQVQQRLGGGGGSRRSNGSAGSSAHSNDSRTVSAQGGGGGPNRSTAFGSGAAGQSWSHGGFVSGQAYQQQQQQHRPPAGGGFRPAGGGAMGMQP